MRFRTPKAPPPGRGASRWFLFLGFYHLLPLAWYLAVAGGLAPGSFLLAAGVASLFAGDSDGFAMAALLLAPALLGGLLFWLAAGLLAALVGRLRRPRNRTLVLLGILGACLVAALQPIFVSGGHGSSYAYSLVDFVRVLGEFRIPPRWSLGYFAALALLLLGLLVHQHRVAGRPPLPAKIWLRRRRLRRRLLVAALLLLIGSVVWTQRTLLIIKPLADAGFAAAQYRLAMTLKQQSIARHGRPGGGYQAWLVRAAEQGHLRAAQELVLHPRNHEEKLRWLPVAAAGGMAEAQYQFYRELSGPHPDLASDRSAGDWLRLAAQAGQTEACFELGRLYLAGQAGLGIDRDPDQARHWWEQAAGGGHGQALEQLAWRYASGADGFPWDADRAIALYARLAAGYRSGELGLPPDPRLATDRQDRADRLSGVVRGLAAAAPQIQAQLGHELLQVAGGTPATRTEGVRLLEQAAAQGDAGLQHELGGLFLFGRHGQPVDLERGRGWWDKALAQDHVPTLEQVALAYQDGRFGYPVDLLRSKALVEKLVAAYRDGRYGVDPDPARAQRWSDELHHFDRLFELAGGDYQAPAALQPRAEAGELQAQYQLGRQLVASGLPAQRREGLAWIERAADGGLAEAQYRLVTFYENQAGILRDDPERGVALLRAAAAQKHLPAMGTLALGFEKGRYGLERDVAQAADWYRRLLQVYEAGDYLGEIDARFIPFNRSRLAVTEKLLQAEQAKAERLQQASPLDREVFAIEERYHMQYEAAVNALPRGGAGREDKLKFRAEVQKLREHYHALRDAEIARLRAESELPPVDHNQ